MKLYQMITEVPLALKSNSACMQLFFFSTILLPYAQNITDRLQASKQTENLKQNWAKFCSLNDNFYINTLSLTHSPQNTYPKKKKKAFKMCIG